MFNQNLYNLIIFYSLITKNIKPEIPEMMIKYLFLTIFHYYKNTNENCLLEYVGIIVYDILKLINDSGSTITQIFDSLQY